MNVETLTKIIELVASLLGIIITVYVVPYLKSKYDKNELDKLREYIEFGVRCAEMYFDSTDGEHKKQYVVNYVKGLRDDVKNLKSFKIDMTNLGKSDVLNKVINHFNDINF